MSFTVDISKFVKRSKKAPKKIRDAVLLKLFGAIIDDTPVDTGRLRGNWNTNIGLPNLKTNNKKSNSAKARATKALSSSQLEDVIYFTNNLPYAGAIEMGHSKQAPQGMMRINLTRFETLVAMEAQLQKVSTKGTPA
jgi:hypothetical protein